MSNKTERDLFRIAKLRGIEPRKGWLKQLAEKHFQVNQRVLSKWIERDRISKRGLIKIEEWGLRHEQWGYDDKIPISPKSAPGSTISPPRDLTYRQTPEQIGVPAVSASDKEGLHARTQQIEIGGQKLTVSMYGPGREWIHQAVDEIMDSEDAATIAALETRESLVQIQSSRPKKIK